MRVTLKKGVRIGNNNFTSTLVMQSATKNEHGAAKEETSFDKGNVVGAAECSSHERLLRILTQLKKKEHTRAHKYEQKVDKLAKCRGAASASVATRPTWVEL